MSIDEFARTTPVRPPIVNRNTNPSAHKEDEWKTESKINNLLVTFAFSVIPDTKIIQ
jgi:hypothetical protein